MGTEQQESQAGQLPACTPQLHLPLGKAGYLTFLHNSLGIRAKANKTKQNKTQHQKTKQNKQKQPKPYVAVSIGGRALHLTQPNGLCDRNCKDILETKDGPIPQEW